MMINIIGFVIIFPPFYTKLSSKMSNRLFDELFLSTGTHTHDVISLSFLRRY